MSNETSLDVSDTIRMKVGDRLPAIDRVLYKPDGTPQDLTGATVQFKFQLAPVNGGAAGTVKGGSCTVLNVAGGQVRYSWAAGDTSVAGVYRAEFIATIGGSDVSFPNQGFLLLIIDPDVS